MRQKLVIFLLAGAMALLSACAGQAETSWAVTEGTQEYRGVCPGQCAPLGGTGGYPFQSVCAGQL